MPVLLLCYGCERAEGAVPEGPEPEPEPLGETWLLILGWTEGTFGKVSFGKQGVMFLSALPNPRVDKCTPTAGSSVSL